MCQVNQFAFQAAKEVFGNSVIVRIATPRHALANAMLKQFIAEGRRSILDASVAVKDQACGRTFATDSHTERGKRKVRINAIRESVSDNLLGTQIFDNGKVQPTFIGWDVGDISNPGLAGLRGVEMPHEKIRRDRATVVGIRGDTVSALPGGMNVEALHQAMNAPSSADDALLTKKVKQAVETHGRVLLVQPHQFS